MPTANIYTADKSLRDPLLGLVPQLRELLAQKLTHGDRVLLPSEVSLRLLCVDGAGMIAPIEIEITAHASRDRVARADAISLSIRDFVMSHVLSAADVRVWLILAELGHSWEE